jgi:hypothetical protein
MAIGNFTNIEVTYFKGCRDIQHNDTRQDGITTKQHKALRHEAYGLNYDIRQNIFTGTLSVVILNVIMLSVITPMKSDFIN